MDEGSSREDALPSWMSITCQPLQLDFPTGFQGEQFFRLRRIHLTV